MARRTLSRLTAAEVKKFAKVPGRYGDGGGLYLQVSPAGVPSWTFRYQVDGRERLMGLGPLHAVTLAEARQAAGEARKMRHGVDRKDPLDERRADRLAVRLASAKAMTFRECAGAYMAAHQAEWANRKHRAQWATSLETYAFPVFGDLPVDQVDKGLILKVLEPIWATKRETASRLRGRIESVLDWATSSEYRQGDNPARWRGHLENLLAKRPKEERPHHAALPYAEIADFMAKLRAVDGVAARALEFTISTAARTGEAIGATWSEIDLKEATWIIPGARMKAGREHRVPLCDRAVAILQAMAAIRTGEFVFPGRQAGRPINDTAFLALLERMVGRGNLTTHGFRSTFRMWAAERTAFPREVCELALAHGIADKVEAAYQRGDLFERRRLLADAWGVFCSRPEGGAGEVVAFRAAQ